MIIKITYKGIMGDTETYKLSKVDKKYSFYFVYKDKKEFHTLIIPWGSVRNIEVINEEE